MTKKVIITFDPRALEINPHVNEDKLALIERNGWGDKEIVILPDNDGTLYVVEGTHRATIALRNDTPINGVLAEDHYSVGSQSAVERVIGMFFLRKES